MKIKIIIVGMAASLLLPLAGAYARVALDHATDQPSGGVYAPGQATDDETMGRRNSNYEGKKGKKGKKGSRGSHGSHGSHGSRGSHGSVSPS